MRPLGEGKEPEGAPTCDCVCGFPIVDTLISDGERARLYEADEMGGKCLLDDDFTVISVSSVLSFDVSRQNKSSGAVERGTVGWHHFRR